MKIFVNVWPIKVNVPIEEFTLESTARLITGSDVRMDLNFNFKDPMDVSILKTANLMTQDFHNHRLMPKVGIKYRVSQNYPMYTLLVDEPKNEDSIDAFVAQYFRWDRIEKQNILSFEEFINK